MAFDLEATTRKDYLLLAANAFAPFAPDHPFKLPLGLENLHPQAMRQMTTYGNVLEVVVNAWNAGGKGIEHTNDGVMKALDVDRFEFHERFCGCHTEDQTMTAAEAQILFLTWASGLDS